MKLTVKALMKMEDTFINMVRDVANEMIELGRSDDQSDVKRHTISFDKAGEINIDFYISNNPLHRMLSVEMAADVRACVHIPYRGPYLFTIGEKEIESGKVEHAEVVDCAKRLMREYALGMACYWMEETGDLKRALEYMDNDDPTSIREMMDGMIDIHINDTGCSIALFEHNGKPIATDAKFDSVGLNGAKSKEVYRHFIKNRLKTYMAFGCAFSGHYDIWSAPLTKTLKEYNDDHSAE
ncbi:hypothetical protein SUREIYA_00330 [Serratia phage vB_SmaM-Sureiya]|nr:hypothetical protein SUREIYA_00330 [Serratia phage vB_SmaM-Sureiya]